MAGEISGVANLQYSKRFRKPFENDTEQHIPVFHSCAFLSVRMFKKKHKDMNAHTMEIELEQCHEAVKPVQYHKYKHDHRGNTVDINFIY